MTAALALPAVAHASEDVAISQTASANVVKKGALVTFTVTVTNQGTQPPPYGGVFVNLFSLKGHGQAANNPYQSVSPSQGTCSIDSAGAYQSEVCSLGDLASGASAQIVAVVKVNESMNHFASLLPTPSQGGYTDDDNSDNEQILRTSVSTPPTLSGSKKIKLKGLPDGCASGDFTLKAVANVTGVKKIVASLSLGFDAEGFGQTWQKAANGNHLRAKVPISRIFEPQLGKLYKLKVKVKRRGGGPLKRTVSFELC